MRTFYKLIKTRGINIKPVKTLIVTAALIYSQLSTAGNASTASRPGVLLLSPGTGSTVYRHSTPTITLSNSATSYVLYVSTSGDFQDGSMLPLLITPEAPLDTVWENAVQSLSGNTIYIAVKSVYSEYNLSELSNGVRLQLQ